jgi:hypothetical protein
MILAGRCNSSWPTAVIDNIPLPPDKKLKINPAIRMKLITALSLLLAVSLHA